MSILKSEHLFDQAERLIVSPGRPRQVDIRRAISSAYYGVFHFIVAAAADEFVGMRQRASARFALVYRSIDHATLRATCLEMTKATLSQRFKPMFPTGGPGPDLQGFAGVTVDLQQRRHRADYDPLPRFATSDARLATGAARGAVRRFAGVDAVERRLFLTLLVCPPRA